MKALNCLAVMVGLLMIISLGYADKVYKSVDAQGNVVFSDTPQPDAVEIELKALQSYSPPAASRQVQATAKKSKNLPMKKFEYSVLSIVSPPDGGTVWDNLGNITVAIGVQPQLDPGDKVRLLLDGNTVGESASQYEFLIEDVDRGEHQLEVAPVLSIYIKTLFARGDITHV
jgi:hypothetical protein